MVRSYHFVGIGGCGMSGLADVFAQRGGRVTGSDMEDSEVIERLRRHGVRVNIGHCSDALPEDVERVVVSAAVPEDNPEWAKARENGVPVCKYAEMLGELSREIATLAVAGTHGKSTTSGWLAYLLQKAHLEPSFVIGADVEQLGAGSGAGRGRHLVVEACEYDRSFLNLRPWAGAILNIEADHLDYYRDVDEIAEAFGEFASLVEADGLLIANADDKKAVQAASKRDGRCEFYGLNEKADWQAENTTYQAGCGCFDLVYRGRGLGRVKLGLPGRHNVSNALAVAGLAREAGATDEQICDGLASFAGVGRRMAYKGVVNGVTVLDDYAHHPTEIRVTLEAIRARYCDSERKSRLWCVFQPHQHSRTRFFLSEFASSFRHADIVLLPEIFFVRESEQEKREVNAKQLAERINDDGSEARYLGDFGRILEVLIREIRQGDVVVTMGAGDVWKVSDELIRRDGRDN